MFSTQVGAEHPDGYRVRHDGSDPMDSGQDAVLRDS